ncbi:hypothetical protein D3C86_941590 [compost metagenome]
MLVEDESCVCRNVCIAAKAFSGSDQPAGLDRPVKRGDAGKSEIANATLDHRAACTVQIKNVSTEAGIDRLIEHDRAGIADTARNRAHPADQCARLDERIAVVVSGIVQPQRTSPGLHKIGPAQHRAAQPKFGACGCIEDPGLDKRHRATAVKARRGRKRAAGEKQSTGIRAQIAVRRDLKRASLNVGAAEVRVVAGQDQRSAADLADEAAA